MKEKDPGAARNTEEPQGIPMMQSYISNIFTTGITSEWAMSMIEDNLATPGIPITIQAWIESSKQWTSREKSKYDKCPAGSREINH